MPRKARVKSETGFYHVTIRGNGMQIIFEDDDDRSALLRIIDSIFPKHALELIAWCFMDNHIHLLIDDPADRMSECMHATMVAYANRFNARSGHRGHVFQERFDSSPVLSDEHLLNAVRYIHLNPQKAGIGPFGSYRWSSHSEYASEGEPSHISQGWRRALFAAPESYIRFMESATPCSYRPAGKRRIADQDVLDVARASVWEKADCELAEIKMLPRDRRDAVLAALKAEGLTCAQIQRLTGIGAWIIKHAA